MSAILSFILFISTTIKMITPIIMMVSISILLPSLYHITNNLSNDFINL